MTIYVVCREEVLLRAFYSLKEAQHMVESSWGTSYTYCIREVYLQTDTTKED